MQFLIDARPLFPPQLNKFRTVFRRICVAHALIFLKPDQTTRTRDTSSSIDARAFMNSTIIRRAILITSLILIVPVTLLTLCAEPAIGQAALAANHNDIGNADAHSSPCAPSYSPRLGIGGLYGRIRYGRRSNASDSKELSPECAGNSPFEIRIDWIVGRTTVWSTEL